MKRTAIMVAIMLIVCLCVSSLQNEVNNKKQRIIKIGLKKELTLGDDLERNEPLFLSVRSLRVDSEGNIYVLDFKAPKLVKLSKTGKLLFSVGQKGQGPGEIQVPLGIELGKDNTILIYDIGNRKVMYLSATTGEFIEEISTAKWPRLTRIDDDSRGFFYGCVKIYEQDKSSIILYKFSSDLKETTEIFRVDSKPLSNEVEVYPANILFRVLDDGRLIVANNQEYRIRIYDSTGILTKVIQSDYTHVSIGEKEKEQELRSRYAGLQGPKDTIFVFPKYYPPIYHLIIDNHENIYIRRYEKAKTGGVYYEEYDNKGKPLGKFALDFTLVCVIDDEIYSMEQTEQGFDQICRYKLNKNK